MVDPLKHAFKWATIVGTYVVACGYVLYRVLKDRKFWRTYLWRKT
jgi:hypothetical protein